MLDQNKADSIATYGGGTLGIIISNLPAVNSALQAILLALSILVMAWKFVHDVKNRGK